MSRAAMVMGIGETEYRRRGGLSGRGELALACDAVEAAARDAGIYLSEIDGLISFANDPNQPALIQLNLGLPELRCAAMAWGGGGGGSAGAMALAQSAVLSGAARVVAVYRSLCQGVARFGQGGARAPGSNFTLPFGLATPAQNIALMARRYMHDCGASEADFATVATIARGHANRNPRALMQAKSLSAEDHAASRMVADPLHLMDCCLESDGAACVIVAGPDRARDGRRAGVPILAAMQGSGPRWGLGFLGGHNMPDETYASANARSLGQRLFAQAGVSPADVDVAQVYDAFTPLVLFTLEDYGFCGRGEAGDWLRSGALALNTSGGSLSEAYIQGLNLVVEAVRQVRGDSTAQAPEVDVAFVAGGGGVAPTSALLLGRP